MKLVKSLLLGSAAIVAAAGAQAADLPARKAAPVDYVRVCSAYGAGFFFIPGTETCLRVGGRVRAEYLWAETFSRAQDQVGFRARGRLNVDARTQTAYGTLRAFMRYEITSNNGLYAGGSGGGTSVNGGGPAFAGIVGGVYTRAGGTATDTALDKAFIQFAGFTAGRASSFFDFYANDLNWGLIRGSEQLRTNLLAYTASFGGGFSATLSVEDRTERESIAGGATYTTVTGPGGVGLVPTGTAVNYLYGGQRLPDIVGALRLDQPWGSAQLSGALRQLTSLNRTVALTPGAPLNFQDTDYGFAIQGGVKINLPMLAAGDVLWLQAAYADGAISYLGYGGAGQSFSSVSRSGEVILANTDAVVDAFGNVKKAKGYAITAAFLHYWAPTVRQGVFGSYSRIEYNNALAPAFAGVPVAAQAGLYPTGAVGLTSDEIRVGSNLIWSPVQNLDIGLEVLYTRVDPKGKVFSAKAAALGLPAFTTVGGVTTANAGFKSADDAWQARIRIQRDF